MFENPHSPVYLSEGTGTSPPRLANAKKVIFFHVLFEKKFNLLQVGLVGKSGKPADVGAAH